MSARPFAVIAAKAGYAITVIDAFADRQTVELAEQAVVVKYGRYGFDADALLGALQKLDLSQFLACIYGSGFEAQPNLLEKIVKHVPVIGNTTETVAILKKIPDFFSVLAQLNIKHPPWFKSLSVNHDANTYLRKFAGGSGGTHITRATSHESALLDNEYYQQWLSGRSVSLLFVANGVQVQVVGFNELWLNPCEEMPFRYGGAVSNVALTQGVRAQLIDAAEKLTLALGLLGLNSLDAIVQDEMVYVLEVNPRLSATVDLYDNARQNLLDHHVQVCLVPFKHSETRLEAGLQGLLTQQAKAHAIVYAPADIEIAPTLDWPDWVVDTPCAPMRATRILAQAPVCTVIAYADNAETAKALVTARIEIVQNMLRQRIA